MDYKEFLEKLESGSLVAVMKKEDLTWQVNDTVIKTIAALFCDLPNQQMWSQDDKQYYGFIDRQFLRPKAFNLDDKLRIVPGGTSIRPGVYFGKKVAVLPPSHINIGAYIDDEAMIDSHVLVGSCARIGRRVHISAGVQIGGVLEPEGNIPTIIEDNCFIGAGAILTEGMLIRSGAVIAPGVTLSKGVEIYDSVNKQVIKQEVPANAVVISGSKPSSNSWLKAQGITTYCAVIIKYRDEKTNASLLLNYGFR